LRADFINGRESLSGGARVRRNRAKSHNRRRTLFAAVRARLGLWLTAFALLSQSLAIAAPPMFPGDARSAATELAALLGPGVVICSQSDSGGTPNHRLDCRQCPLCQVVANAAALDAPAAPPLIAPTRALAIKLGVSAQPRLLPRPAPAFSLARGPPSQT
jgi:hypothetical protein